MSTAVAPLVSFHWRSWLGAAVVIFVINGLVNILAAIVVPLSLSLGGAGALGGGGVVFSGDGDAALLGRPLEVLRQTDPKLDALLVSSMLGMCSQMMQFAVVALGLAWFALRRGERWALWFLVVGSLIGVPYYVIIAATYAAHGAPASGLLAFLPFWAVPIAGLVVGFIGLRRAGIALDRAAT